MLTATIAHCPSIRELYKVISGLRPIGSAWQRDVHVMSADTSETIPISRISDAFFKLISSQQNLTYEELTYHQKTLDRIKSFNESFFKTLQTSYFEHNLQAYLSDSSATGNKREAVARIRQAFYAQLTALVLNCLALNKLPDALWQLTQLEYLCLWENQLTTLPDALCQLVQLECLGLSQNKLTTLPNSVGLLTRLHTLYLSENNLIKLPDSLGMLTHLHTLYLSENQLTELPVTMGQLALLKNLYLEGNCNLRELPLILGSLPGLIYIDIDGTALNLQLVTTLLQQCAAVRRAQMSTMLLKHLQTWKTAGNSQVDLSEIEMFTDEDKGILNQWLVRLERTCDFKGHQEFLAQAVCEMLRSMTQDQALKMLFLAHMTVNIRHCYDRASQSFNELYTSWKVQECSKDASLQERLSIMVRGAKTLALRDAIAARIKNWEQANERDEQEAVEIYLFYEITLKEQLDLLSIIQTMHHSAIGQRDWIDQEKLIATVLKSYLHHLIDIPAFAKILTDNKEFMEMWNPQADEFAKTAEALNNSPRARSAEFSKEGIQYRSEMDAVMQKCRQAHQETVVNWLALCGIRF